MALQHIYCIAGLGADFRIFEKLKISHSILHPIEWEIPEIGETLPQFAARLSKQIVHPNPILLGVSFGGMLATEMSHLIKGSKTIIISSCKHHKELPRFLKFAGLLRLHKAVPWWIITKSNTMNRFVFDTRSKAEELYLKRLMLKHSDLTFIKRSVHMILTWQTTPGANNIIHIHGKRDKLLRQRHVQANYWLQDGGHFMIWNKASEISQIISQIIPPVDNAANNQ